MDSLLQPCQQQSACAALTHDWISPNLHLRKNLTKQGKPPLALEAFEKVGPEGGAAIHEISKDIATSLTEWETAAD